MSHASFRSLLAGSVLATLFVAGGTSQAATPPTLEQKAVKVAAAQVGKPYQYGAAGPNAFDCAGLTQYSFHAAGRSLPRTALAQYRAIRHIPLSAVRPGDLLFMANSGQGTNPNGIDHVGVYAGNDYWYVARSSGTRITRQHLWTHNVWAGRP